MTGCFRRERRADHSDLVTATQQRVFPDQHVRDPTLDAPRPSRTTALLTASATHHTLTGRSPRAETTPTNRAPQLACRQSAFDFHAVSSYDSHQCPSGHQQEPSRSLPSESREGSYASAHAHASTPLNQTTHHRQPHPTRRYQACAASTSAALNRRQHTLTATLDWSFVLLDEREQIVFDRLAVFVGWFTLDDAVAVAVAADPALPTGTPLTEADVLDAVSALVDKSMCIVDLGATPARYRYLETMRAYGRDHLSSSGTLAECRTRHAAHIAVTAGTVLEALVGPGELDASRHAERLMPDLRAALGWAVDHHLDDVIDSIAALASLMSFRGSHEVEGWFYDLRHDLPEHRLVQEAAMQYA